MVNITHRKKTIISNSDEQLTTSKVSNSTSLTKDDVRAIFREEFNFMRSALVEELQQTLKQMVRAELQSMKNEITSLESSVIFLNNNYETTKTEITTYRDSLKDLQKENINLINTVQDLTTRLNVMEQHNRSSNLEFQCVPEHKNENLISIITQISKVISCDLKQNDIHHCTRVAKTNKDDNRPRSIVVKLASPRLRDTFLANTIKFNKANPNDKINTSHIGMGGNKAPIYVAEHLSPTNKKLHAAARLASKEKGYKFVWVKQGRVFMRKAENTDYVYVKNLDILNKLQ
ncbi:uncharacterized protein LOC123875295 [Maniola jurtina]|uniref:uncharacterized protein LOC123875295 n=1 Tax=Maniola jurtina TaxID=191418 RepID=UPI001E686717|nr:uncharacterized protein LOC123875295 [Maniola jurtina]